MNKRKLLNITLILLIIISIGLSGYLFFLRKVDVNKESIVYNRTLVKDISESEAEKLNYDIVTRDFTVQELDEINFSEYESGSKVDFTNQTMKKLVNWKNSKLEYDDLDVSTFTSILYSENYEDYKSEDLFQEFQLLASTQNLKTIILDTSMQTNLEEFYTFVEKLQSIEEMKVGIFLNPRSAELLNYVNYKEFNKTITKILDIPRLNNLADLFYIKAYDYTPIKAVLPGPNSKLTEIEDIIQYYIYKGIDRSKVYLGINKVNFEWEDKFYEVDISRNLIIDKIFAQQVMGNISSLTEISEFEKEDSYGFYTKESKVYIVVYPNNSLINNIQKLAISYNLYGIYFRY